ncbi:exosortase-associated protein EpsI, B-type [Paludibacterium sp.]|uniref:exosortase-associated protein EpsI, B-type n=1 Tax=Paludibacterium sp. TaxID=1917523 RepID=UPI0025FF8688|nr:exosortase-associated protein EpsI, B-type [Paludibacterium sp.]MBV8648445.1 EpsI family protein [Paludibacterium sp.]
MKTDWVKTIVLALVMAGASLLALAITPRHFLADIQSREHLAELLPDSFGDWTVDTSIIPIPPSPDLQKVLDATYDETVALTYRNGRGERIMLSLAYARNQHKGMITHRPEICYPAQGFKLVAGVENADLKILGGQDLPVKHLVAAMGPRNEPITYWVMVGDEMTEFGYPHRWVAIRYGLKGVVPDGVLVRVSSITGDNTAGFALQDRFIQDLLKAIPASRRHRLIGASYS